MKKKKTNELAIIDPKMIAAEVEAKMPEWVKKIHTKEDMGNAVYATSQELLMAIDDILIRYFGFSEDDIKKFHKELKDILEGVKEFEDHGLNVGTPHSIDIIGEKIQQVGIEGLLMEIAQTKLVKERLTRAGLEYPVSLAATPFLKKLKEKNN